MLETYKIWFVNKSKAFRVLFVSSLLVFSATALQVFPPPDGALLAKIGAIALIAFLSLWTSYNQFIESDYWDECKQETAEAKFWQQYWQEQAEDQLLLTQYCSKLVLQKSDIWSEAYKMAAAPNADLQAARAYVRNQNSLKFNLDRLIGLAHGYLERISRAGPHEIIRVAYFVPNESETHLEIKSLFNDARALPRNGSISKDQGFASHVFWPRDSNDLCFIDDVKLHMESLNEISHYGFRYFYSDQKRTIRSIFGFRIVDGATLAPLGVVCVDSNVPNFFKERVGLEGCQTIAEVLRTRVIFETRFSAMKEALGNYG